MSAAVDWVAEGLRPAGQPGTVRDAYTYPAVQTPDTVWLWRDTVLQAPHWIEAHPALADTFEPGPEWQARCDHLNAVPWLCCDSGAECDRRAREGR